MEVRRLGVQSELQLLAYTTATAMQHLSHICNLYHSSQQHQIPNPLSKARDQTCILVDASQIRQPLSCDRNSQVPDLDRDLWVNIFAHPYNKCSYGSSFQCLSG